MKQFLRKSGALLGVWVSACALCLPLGAQGPHGGSHGGPAGGHRGAAGGPAPSRSFSPSGRDSGRGAAPSRSFSPSGRDSGRGAAPSRSFSPSGRDSGRGAAPSRSFSPSSRDFGSVHGPGREPVHGPARENFHGGTGPMDRQSVHFPHSGGPHYSAPPHHPLPPPHHPISRPEYHPHHDFYRPYYYDPIHYYYGWHPVYRPIYPWWIDVAEFSAGYAMGYYVANGRPVYYYYPSAVTVRDDSSILYVDETPVVTEEFSQESVESAPESITEAISDDILEDAEPSVAPSILQKEESASAMELPKITRAEVDGAWKGLQAGDSAFAKGDLASAVESYSKVSADLAAMPDAWFRLAYAEMARGNYELASDYCVKGMEASRVWPSSPFALDYVYQGASDRKKTNLQALQTAAENAPADGRLNLLAGLAFYSDGQNAEAARFLKKAQESSPDLKEFVEPMLKNIP